MGGAGSAVLEALQAAGVQKPLLQLGLPDRFIEHGDPAKLLAGMGLDAPGIDALDHAALRRAQGKPQRSGGVSRVFTIAAAQNQSATRSQAAFSFFPICNRSQSQWIVVPSSRMPASPACWPQASRPRCTRRPPSAGAWPPASPSRSTRSTAAREVFANAVKAMSGGKFEISVHAAGELMPAFGVVDGVQQGSVEACHTAPYYFFGKNPAFALGCAIPFGMNAAR